MSNVIANPTWDDISKMISDFDVSEMKKQGLDLRSYDQVSKLAHKIYYYLAYKIMPLGGPWTDDQISTYNNWLINGMPKDAAHQEEIAAGRIAAVASTGNRVRKDINDLTKDEQDKLIKAFKGLMSRDPKTPDEYDENKLCYFSLAAKHWFPVPTYCQHHIFSFVSWHRWQMLDFENALRSVEGCEDVTLPYWNIETGEFPELVSQPPFNEYTFPINVYPDFYDHSKVKVGEAGTTTQRYSSFAHIKDATPEQIECYRSLIKVWIKHALDAPTFAEFNGLTSYEFNARQEDKIHNDYKSKTSLDTKGALMKAHDLGHAWTGLTMGNQDIAAFDPIFWFFHCNWDRVWWDWQVRNKATDLEGFESTIDGSIDDHRWLTDPEMSISDPFGQTNSDSIDSTSLGVTYAPPASATADLAAQALVLPKAIAPSWRDKNEGQRATSSFTLSKNNLDRVSLRVKGINRLNIFGSFWVILYLGGEEVGRDGFFQSTFSGDCENCVAQSRVDFDFVFDRSELSDENGNPKEVKVTVVNAITNEVMPFDQIGDPTINIRMLH